ncbi:hypothetical protein DFP73DRAFT_588574 [Morchella snyderi]|nr:hypothetical protein DFP73DRAFT_588574 [Morchella snyderi]
MSAPGSNHDSSFPTPNEKFTGPQFYSEHPLVPYEPTSNNRQPPVPESVVQMQVVNILHPDAPTQRVEVRVNALSQPVGRTEQNEMIRGLPAAQEEVAEAKLQHIGVARSQVGIFEPLDEGRGGASDLKRWDACEDRALAKQVLADNPINCLRRLTQEIHSVRTGAVRPLSASGRNRPQESSVLGGGPGPTNPRSQGNYLPSTAADIYCLPMIAYGCIWLHMAAYDCRGRLGWRETAVT